MDTTMHCMICEKHKDFGSYVGMPITELGDLFVSHFPVIENERANKGHLIIEPKRHITDATELTDDEAKSLGLLIRDSIKLLRSALDAEHAYVFRLNDKVAHFHVHVV